MGIFSRAQSARMDKPNEQRELSALPAKCERVAERLIIGKTIAEIASDLAMTREEVRSVARRAETIAIVKSVFEQRRNAASRELDAGTLEAIRYLRDTLNDTTATTKERIKCAVELLDRGGFARGLKVDIHNNETGNTIEIEDLSALTDEQIEEAARVALERRARVKVLP
jgi:hypothetical protein